MLLCSARTIPDEARIRALVYSGIEWPLFQQLATRHSVRPLVYRSLRTVCWERIPAAFRTAWERECKTLTGRNLFLAGELLRIQSELETAGIEVAVMKGAVIAAMVYGDCALREFGDLDLLIREPDFPRALDLLRQLSYEPVWKCDARKALRFLRHVGEFAVASDLWHIEVDLHWRVATKATALSPGLEDFPSGFKPVLIAGSNVLSFAPHDLPLYLAAQGGWDQWSDLRRICDVAEFLRTYPVVEWEPHLESAERLGGLRSMLPGLLLASNLLGAEVPEAAVSRIRADAMVTRLADRSIQLLEGKLNSPEAVSRYAFQLRAKRGVRGKIALAYSIAMDRTAKDGMWLMLPRPLWWMYGLLRPLRIGRMLLRKD